MRIIAGRLGGRNFSSPRRAATHPMSERIRGAIFNALGDMTGLSVLDAYAGSGALGLEAASRGAAPVYLVDSSRGATRVIQRNVTDLGLQAEMFVVQADITNWLKRPGNKRFQLIFIDPPFSSERTPPIDALAAALVPGGLATFCWPGQRPLPTPDGLSMIKRLEFNDAKVAFYRRDL